MSYVDFKYTRHINNTPVRSIGSIVKSASCNAGWHARLAWVDAARFGSACYVCLCKHSIS